MTKTKRILQTYQAFLYLSYGSLRSRKEDALEMKGPMAKLFLYRKRIDTIFIYKAFLKIRNVKSRLSSSPNLSTELSTTKIFFFFYSGLIKHTQLSRHPITAQFLNYCYTTLKAPSLNTVEANELLSLSKVCRWRHLLEQILHEPKTNEMLHNISPKQVGR